MSVYLDANVLVALFNDDALSAGASALMASIDDAVLVSDFAGAEFASTIARFVRVGAFDAAAAHDAFADFDQWTDQYVRTVALNGEDVRAASMLVRRLDLNLRTPDALHIAIAQRLSATMATFDLQMRRAALSLGVSVLPETL